MRTMYDSITAADIPTSCDLVAGYVDGRYAWTAADWARFPGKVKVRIAVLATTDDGHVLDIETGDAFPWQAPMWARTRRLKGVDPTCYVNLSNVRDVIDAFAGMNEPLPHLWLAHYDGVRTIPQGYVAKQYADEAMTGGHYDASVVADFWPGVDTMPNPNDPVTHAELEAYKAALQKQLDENYAPKAHPHTAATTVSANTTITG